MASSSFGVRSVSVAAAIANAAGSIHCAIAWSRASLMRRLFELMRARWTAHFAAERAVVHVGGAGLGPYTGVRGRRGLRSHAWILTSG